MTEPTTPRNPGDLPAVRYVIGLDIGDGESALAWSEAGDLDSAKVYKRQSTGETSILTALSYAGPDGAPVFGEEAVLKADAQRECLSSLSSARHCSVNSRMPIRTLMGPGTAALHRSGIHDPDVVAPQRRVHSQASGSPG
jgi:hypothetical protein